MELNEKILSCRKKAGLSQEELSQRIGVSRQAVSKWEIGDSEPEVGKLLLLAETFEVSVDWLLSREESSNDKEYPASDAASTSQSWVDSVPGLIGRMLRKYGWVSGIFVAVAGLGSTLLGALARMLVRGMSKGIDGFFPDDAVFAGGPGFEFNESFSNMLKNNPISIFGTVLIVVGIVLMVAGVVLAVALRRRYSPVKE